MLILMRNGEVDLMIWQINNNLISFFLNMNSFLPNRYLLLNSIIFLWFNILSAISVYFTSKIDENLLPAVMTLFIVMIWGISFFVTIYIWLYEYFGPIWTFLFPTLITIILFVIIHMLIYKKWWRSLGYVFTILLSIMGSILWYYSFLGMLQ